MIFSMAGIGDLVVGALPSWHCAVVRPRVAGLTFVTIAGEVGEKVCQSEGRRFVLMRATFQLGR